MKLPWGPGLSKQGARESLGRAWRAVSRDPAVRSAAPAFALSRAIVLVLLVAAAHLTSGQPGPDRIHNSYLSLHGEPVWRKTREALLTADTNWYLGIAQEGYARGPFALDRPRNWAFFPLYPLLLRAAAPLFGNIVDAGLVLSHLFFFLALVLLHKTAATFGLDEAARHRAVFYLALSPVSYFFSLPLPESLFLMLTLGSFYAARRERWAAAGLLGALASATRMTGVLLVPVLLLLYWQQRRGRRLTADVLYVFLAPAGLFAFMLYLHRLTGNALAFKDAQAASGWDRRPSLWWWQPLFEYLRKPGELIASWNFSALNFCAAVLALACGVAWLRRREYALGAYTLLAVIIALSSGLLQSHGRYVSVIFPVFIWLGALGQRRAVDETIRAVFAALLGLMTALFAAHFAFVMS